MRTLYILLLSLCSIGMMAQSRADMKRIEEIKRARDRYVIGEGYAKDQESADQIAVSQLLQSISTNVEADMKLNMNQEQLGQDASSVAETQNRVRIKSYGKLVGSESVVVRDRNGEFYVLRYIEQAKLDEMYKKREAKAVALCRDGEKAVMKGSIGDALKYYYHSLCLLRSLPNSSDVNYMQEGNMQKYLVAQITTLFRGIQTQLGEQQGNQVQVLFTYDGKPLKNNFDFTFFNGQLPNKYTAKDGVASITVPASYTEERLHLRYEYEYADQAQLDDEVEMATRMYKGRVIQGADVYLARAPKKEARAASQQIAAVMQEETAATHEALQRKDKKDYAAIVLEVINAIKQRRFDSVRQHFTAEGFGMFEALMKYGNPQVVGAPELQFYPMLGKVVCRSVPMQFTFKSNHKTFREDVTFTFDSSSLIECVAFSLGKEARDNIFMKNRAGLWNDSVCMVIATFLENYKTAFALKRLDYIRKIFSDEAVIITGHVVRDTQRRGLEGTTSRLSPKVEFTRQNKEEYMENLARCFASNEYININFADSEVRKKKDMQRYGINIKQEYFSSSYGDTGYLFLYVDFEKPDEPMIYFRSWQPERDEDGKVFGMADMDD